MFDFVTLLLLVVLSPLLMPIGAEWWFGAATGCHLSLVLHAILFLLTLALYRWRIRSQGRLLPASEVRILKALT